MAEIPSGTITASDGHPLREIGPLLAMVLAFPTGAVPLDSPMTSKGSVLVVDDDPILLEVTRARLERAGWQVFVRDHALGTAQWVAAHRPEIVLLDVGMPAVTGDTLAGILSRNGLDRDIGIILHSGLGAEELATLKDSTGVLGAIQKTGNDDQFMTEFDRLVDAFRDRHSAP